MPTQDQIEGQTGAPGALHADLADVIDRWTVGKEDCATPIPNLDFFRREKLTEPRPCLVEPSIVFVVQGAKQLLIGDQAYVYDTNRFLIASLDLPGSSQVLEASPDRPCLGLMLRLDRRVIAELVAQVGVPAPRDRLAEGALPSERSRRRCSSPSVACWHCSTIPARLRCLRSSNGKSTTDSDERSGSMAANCFGGKPEPRIARAIDWLKRHYTEPLRIDELAARPDEHIEPASPLSPAYCDEPLAIPEVAAVERR